jgi:four helix bundle protein
MDERAFKDRTKRFALAVIRLVQQLLGAPSSDVIGRQILRSAMSIEANYRAACRAKSLADMINKLKMVEEEADETLYWLELLGESGILQLDQLSALSKECDELVAMTVASLKTLRSRQSSIANRKS